MSKVGLSSIALGVLIGAALLGTRCWTDGGERSAAAPGARALEDLEQLADTFPAPGDAALAWPRDHGTKPEQFAESWLFAGLLEARDGVRFGFQLEFQRLAVQPEAPDRASSWAARDVYRARLSVEPDSDPARSGERFSRGALGLAGARPAPARVWIEDWSFAVDVSGGGIVLRAADLGFGLELRLAVPEAMPVAVDGQLYRGYWWPGLDAEGAIVIDGRRVPVTGRAMLDRLWGQALPAGRGQQSLTRIWLEDGDGTAIRCEQLRRKGGGGTPLIECLGHPAAAQDIALEPVDDGWQSIAGVRYPLRWEVRLSAADRPLQVAPLSPMRSVALEGGWSGVVAVAEREQAWGLLVLSNYEAP
jgi:predicted secreted hydrolase